MWDWAADWITKMLKSIAENSMLEKTITDQIDKTYGLFDEGGFVNNIADALKPVGFAMCALFFIMALYDLAMQDRFDLEMFIKFFTKFALGVGVIIFSDKFVQLSSAVSLWIQELIANAKISNSLAEAEKHMENLKGGSGGLGTVIMVGLIGMILELVFAIVTACITVVCFSRVMEMALRACFMPIALGLISEDGFKGAGGRYIKRYIALAAQGPALIIIAKIHSAIVAEPLIQFCTGNDGGTELLASVIPLVGVSFAAVALCFKSISVINDVFGA